MAQMMVRNIDERVHRRLKELAAKNGVSVEEQVRQMIAAFVGAAPGCARSRTLGDAIVELNRKYPGVGFEDGDIVELRGPIRVVDFSDHP